MAAPEPALLHQLTATVRRWWDGKTTPYENEPGSPVVFIGWDTERHWTASAARALVAFVKTNLWQVISTTVAIVGLLIAYKKL